LLEHAALVRRNGSPVGCAQPGQFVRENFRLEVERNRVVSRHARDGGLKTLVGLQGRWPILPAMVGPVQQRF